MQNENKDEKQTPDEQSGMNVRSRFLLVMKFLCALVIILWFVTGYEYPEITLFFTPVVLVCVVYLFGINQTNMWLNLLGVLLFSFIAFGCFTSPSLLNARRSAWENRCKLTLRALGSSQLAFMDKNDGNYGTWEEMIKQDYIQEGYNQDNIIDEYSIIEFVIKKSTYNEDGESNFDSSFTIVAVPEKSRKRLRTFAIGDDQTPSVWVGDGILWDEGMFALHDLKYWEPLR